MELFGRQWWSLIPKCYKCFIKVVSMTIFQALWNHKTAWLFIDCSLLIVSSEFTHWISPIQHLNLFCELDYHFKIVSKEWWRELWACQDYASYDFRKVGLTCPQVIWSNFLIHLHCFFLSFLKLETLKKENSMGLEWNMGESKLCHLLFLVELNL